MKDLPFNGKTQSEVVGKILKCDYPKLASNISKPWHKLIKGMLRVQPNKRWNMMKIIEHLYKYKYNREASISSDSVIETEEEKSSIKKKEIQRFSTSVKQNKSPIKAE